LYAVERRVLKSEVKAYPILECAFIDSYPYPTGSNFPPNAHLSISLVEGAGDLLQSSLHTSI
jgi:hypothetical protein